MATNTLFPIFGMLLAITLFLQAILCLMDGDREYLLFSKAGMVLVACSFFSSLVLWL